MSPLLPAAWSEIEAPAMACEPPGPRSRAVLDRIEATGSLNGARSWLVGENLVWGSEELSTPSNLVKAWMNSPPHRENSLRRGFTEVGIGLVRGAPEPQAAGATPDPALPTPAGLPIDLDLEATVAQLDLDGIAVKELTGTARGWMIPCTPRGAPRRPGTRRPARVDRPGFPPECGCWRR